MEFIITNVQNVSFYFKESLSQKLNFIITADFLMIINICQNRVVVFVNVFIIQSFF